VDVSKSLRKLCLNRKAPALALLESYFDDTSIDSLLTNRTDPETIYSSLLRKWNILDLNIDQRKTGKLKIKEGVPAPCFFTIVYNTSIYLIQNICLRDDEKSIRLSKNLETFPHQRDLKALSTLSSSSASIKQILKAKLPRPLA
jgi:hypothetical protein